MFRYIALIWNEHSPDHTRRAEELCEQLRASPASWQSAIHLPGLFVGTVGAKPFMYGLCNLQNRVGLIVGAIYDRANNPVFDLLADATDEAVASRGKSLVRNYWGNYVAFLKDARTGRVFVLRSPSGVIRCFVTEIDGVRLVCSHIEDCVSLPVRFTFNWDYIAAELCRTAAMGWSKTALCEVSSLEPGVCLQTSGLHQEQERHWCPAEIAGQRIDDFDEAVEEARRIAIGCIRAWVARQPHAMLLLSGGLDSAVILAAIQDMPSRPTITCLNLHYDGPGCDERYYARLCAQRAGLPLLEQERSRDVQISSLLSMPPSARPTSNHTDHIMFGRRATSLACERGAAAVLMGQMGDELFCRTTGLFGALDFVWTHGPLHRDLFAVAGDVAAIRGTSAWFELRHAIPYGLLTRPGIRRWRHALTAESDEWLFIQKKAVEPFDFRCRQKWLQSVDSLPLGKLHQITQVMGAQAYYAEIGSPEDPDWLLPLHAQPLVELCLRVPTSLHVKGGNERAIERQAFAAEVPRQIIDRRTKGSTAQQREDNYANNRHIIQSLLLDGLLAQKGFIGRSALEKYFAQPGAPLNHPELIDCLKVEAWLRIWHGPATTHSIARAA